MVKTCPNCGRENLSSAKFCRFCGTKLNEQKSIDHNNLFEYKTCPHCGFKNNKDARFCASCGYSFINLHKQNKINSTINKKAHASTKIFNDYFNWLIQTVQHPLTQVSSKTHYGTISLIIIIVLLWVEEVKLRNVPKIANNVNDFVLGNIPLRIYKNNWINTTSPLGLLILSIAYVVITIGIAYCGRQFVSQSRLNLITFINRYIHLINITIITLVLDVVSIVLNVASLAWLFNLLTMTIFIMSIIVSIVNVSHPKQLNINRIYIAIFAVVISIILQNIVVSFCGAMLA